MRAAAPLLLAVAVAGAGAGAPAPWRARLDELAARRDGMGRDLEAALEGMKPRLTPELLAEVEAAPAPKPLPVGYGLLPPLLPDRPESGPKPPVERRSDLPALETWLSREVAAAAASRRRAADPGAPAAELVADFKERRLNFERLDETVAYHAAWQPVAGRDPAYDEGRRELLAAYRRWRATGDRAARRLLERGIAEFKPTPGLRLREDDDGSAVLPLTIDTDIDDAAFLRAFEEGVERVWNGSAAMRAARLRLSLRWRHRDPRRLYRGEPPARGAAIDPAAHAKRFGRGRLVLTTGAAAVQSYTNHAIIVGRTPTTRHLLAHELSHLLGFSDGYLRAYEGSPSSPDGVTWWVITPFPDDLLSDPETGRVSAAMAARLREAYSAP